MDSHSINAVLIVAAGRGSRMLTSINDLPKQYQTIIDHSVLYHAIQAFEGLSMIDSILVVIHPDDEDLYYSSIPENSKKLLMPIHGANDRQGSVLNGLKALQKSNPDIVYIHDAARPFVTADIISRLDAALQEFDGALPGLIVEDTLKLVEDGQTRNTVPRDNLWRAQTPQAFHYNKILKAHEAVAASDTNTTFTDDTSIAEWYGYSVAMVLGHEYNRKITRPTDMLWAREVLERKMTSPLKPAGVFLVGSGFDVHAFEDGDHVTLCGIEIPHEQSLKGHSDADVAMHALTDALYGALADGDIGTHFPPSEPQWKGAASSIFLEHAINRIKERNGIIQNIDITIMCEAPKIGPHAMKMREKLSDIMGLNIKRISVKATTTEKLGFTGRKEGIASLATASVWLPEEDE